MQNNSVKDFIKNNSQKVDEPDSFYATDPISGNVSLHGATNKRPKAYAGEIIDCPWDNPNEIILSHGEAFLVKNDFPALRQGSVDHAEISGKLTNLYEIKNARGECLVIIYSKKHEGHWLNLTSDNKVDVINLWKKSTLRSLDSKKIKYAHIFENDGPSNSMKHPHGQQYNFLIVPPFIQKEIDIAKEFFDKNNNNLNEKVLETELNLKERIVFENKHFIAFVPPGAKWPYQIRVLPKRRVNWVFEFDEYEVLSLVETIDIVRNAYNKMYTGSYKPTIMMNLHQSPLDKENEKLYKTIYGLRIEFYNTALSSKAEKLMFSLENSTGLIAYSNLPEDIADEIRSYI